MKTSTSRKTHKPQPVPELIKELWNLYFEMSLDPDLEASAVHVRSAALTLEHTRRMALEVAQESLPNNIDGFETEDGRQADEDERPLPAKNAKFGSITKH
jgi:hypothetical protein